MKNIELPGILPVFQVKSTILMPHAQLPICISNSSYLSSELIDNNIVGIIQPKPGKTSTNTEKFKIGCAGQIKEITSIDDETTVLICGLCRFEIIKELPTDKFGLDRAYVSYDKYKKIDMESDNSQVHNKQQLLYALSVYFKSLKLSPNWNEIKNTPAPILISALTMACPLHPSEKQAVLETTDIQGQSDVIVKMIKMHLADRFHTTNSIN